MKLESSRTKDLFEKLGENVKVYRHPSVLPLQWSHHQKLVIIDQELAFIGGLDLCFGRYDDEKHLLLDNGEVKKWIGKDYYNPRFKKIKRLDHPAVDYFDRSTTPRM